MSAAQTGKKMSPEAKIKVGDFHRGKKMSDETRAKMSASHSGRKKSPEHAAAVAAANTLDFVGYGQAHDRHRELLPHICEMIDGTCRGRLQVALRHDRVDVATLPRGGQNGCAYSLDIAHYSRLCQSHHDRLDHGGL